MSQQQIISVKNIQPGEKRQRIFAIVGASSGNLVEWFDFYIYAFFSLYFAAAFFPDGDSTSKLLKTAAIFAVGFFMRPIGGWLFGYIADKHGRRLSMMIAVCMMCSGSLIIACLPTYATIGHWAPVLLLLARLLQGLSVGGEYGTSATYMSEVAVEGQRGFYASFQYVTLIGGQLLASLVLVVLQRVLVEKDLLAWGWRIPFVIGALLAIVALFLRRSLNETTDEKTRQHRDAGTFRGVWKHRRPFMMVLGFTAGGSLIFYTFTTYMQKYLVNTVGMDNRVATNITTLTLLVYMILQPFFGALSDRIGRRNSMIMFSLLSTLFTVPILFILKSTTNPYAAFMLIIVALAIISFYTSISGLVKAELFPPEVRALCVGLSYAVANALFGGSAEYVALLLKSFHMENMFFWYVSFMCAISLWVSLKLRRKGQGVKLL